MNGHFGMPEGWCQTVPWGNITDSALMLKGKDDSMLKLAAFVDVKQEFKDDEDNDLAKYADVILGDMPLKEVTLQAMGDRIATTFKSTVKILNAPHAGDEDITITCKFVDLKPVVREAGMQFNKPSKDPNQPCGQDTKIVPVVGFGTWELSKEKDATQYEGWITEPSGRFRKKKFKRAAERVLTKCNQLAQKVFDAVLKKVQVGSRPRAPPFQVYQLSGEPRG